jgi:hypothetical protein
MSTLSGFGVRSREQELPLLCYAFYELWPILYIPGTVETLTMNLEGERFEMPHIRDGWEQCANYDCLHYRVFTTLGEQNVALVLNGYAVENDVVAITSVAIYSIESVVFK